MEITGKKHKHLCFQDETDTAFRVVIWRFLLQSSEWIPSGLTFTGSERSNPSARKKLAQGAKQSSTAPPEAVLPATATQCTEASNKVSSWGGC